MTGSLFSKQFLENSLGKLYKKDNKRLLKNMELRSTGKIMKNQE
jgi:hypothetical protein